MKIVVINPNSDPVMTANIREAAERFADGRMEVETVLTEGAPKFIDYYEDEFEAAPGMIRIVRSHPEADAFIVACHCDPALELLRTVTEKPVIGIGEASFRTAVMLGGKFSVIITEDHSYARKCKLIHEYGMDQYCSSVRIRDSRITDEKEAYLKAAQQAIEEDYAEVIILGCAGLCSLTDYLQAHLSVPVIDGVVAALGMAEGMVHAGYRTSKVRLYADRKYQ